MNILLVLVLFSGSVSSLSALTQTAPDFKKIYRYPYSPQKIKENPFKKDYQKLVEYSPTGNQRADLEKEVKEAFEKYKKAKEAGAGEYYGSQQEWENKYNQLRQFITTLSGQVIEEGNSIKVIWKNGVR